MILELVSFLRSANLPPRPSVTFEVENTSITEWRIDPDHTALMRYNDHAHLTPSFQF